MTLSYLSPDAALASSDGWDSLPSSFFSFEEHTLTVIPTISVMKSKTRTPKTTAPKRAKPSTSTGTRKAKTATTELHVGDVYTATSDEIAHDMSLLRRALAIHCTDAALAEQIKREMRLPVYGDLKEAQDAARVKRARMNGRVAAVVPNYNYGRFITEALDSLWTQTRKPDEIIIVDDASTDGTAELVRGWQQDAAFPIRYVRQEHGGKHAAFNRGVSLATGDLFLSIDSDDACVPEALERFWHHWVSIDPAAQPPFSAVTALAADQDGRVIGEPFAMSPTDSTSLEMYFGRGPRGDNWGFHATNVLRQFPFPEPPGVTFVAESIVWFAISRRYRTRYVNDVLLTVHSDAQGTRLSSLSPGTARGRLMFHQAVIEDYLDFLFRSPGP